MKIALNSWYSRFGLSEQAYKELGLKWDGKGTKYNYIEKRTDPKLIEVIEKLGDLANGERAKIRIVEIPDGVEWEILDNDGEECIRW